MSTGSQHIQTEYLDFNAHHPVCHKRSVVCTLLRRAKNIPSTQEGKRKETKRVKSVLRENNYPPSFINKCERSLSKPPADLPTNGFVVLPYVQGISEKIGHILRQQESKVAYKPLKTVANKLEIGLQKDNENKQQKSANVNLTETDNSRNPLTTLGPPVPKVNKTYEIYMFRNASQNSGESLDSYCTRLRRLAQTCEFDNEDEEIKSHIVVSCLSSRLRRRALREDMDLKALLDSGRGLEMSDKQA
ncbi:hypothetical protein ACROYT_G021535 [Oculina patagonica]